MYDDVRSVRTREGEREVKHYSENGHLLATYEIEVMKMIKRKYVRINK